MTGQARAAGRAAPVRCVVPTGAGMFFWGISTPRLTPWSTNRSPLRGCGRASAGIGPMNRDSTVPHQAARSRRAPSAHDLAVRRAPPALLWWTQTSERKSGPNRGKKRPLACRFTGWPSPFRRPPAPHPERPTRVGCKPPFEMPSFRIHHSAFRIRPRCSLQRGGEAARVRR